MESTFASPMSSSIATTPRPAAVWPLSLVLGALAFLTAVGGVIFNLSSADDASEVLTGLALVALATSYAVCAVRITAGSRRAWQVALAAVAAHGLLFNLVLKVAIEGETESLMFVVLAAVGAGLLLLPSVRRFARR